MNSTLQAIGPVDGRYYEKTKSLSTYFSEYALIRYRVKVEIEYFIALCEYPLPELTSFPKEKFNALRNIYSAFTEENAQEIKDIEKVTNHDVKAVEYFLKRHFDNLGLEKYKEFVHFGLTSQDINNTAVPLSMKDGHEAVLLPKLQAIIQQLSDKALSWKTVPMLAHTHGQPASPTLLGKEIQVFVYRLNAQLSSLQNIPFAAKFGGATGNFNAHHVAYPDIDWIAFANNFVNEKLHLTRSLYTTQIENYDHMAAYFDALKRINIILIDLCRDIWMYISMNYFKQRIKAGEVGSSAMPHKVNPIDFENAEGNLGIANALLEHLSHKLPISRLQRDLTDSTVSRNIGVPIAHTLIALTSLAKGLDKLLLNEQALYNDLDRNWAVVAEAVQTILRSINYPDPYEKLKDLTRTNGEVNAKTIADFVDTLEVNEDIKNRLKKITPHNYVGIY